MQTWKHLFGAGLMVLVMSAGVPSARAIAQPDASAVRVSQTHSASAAPAVSTVGGDAIANGGFESGTSPWVQYSSSNYNLITTVRPHTGAWGVWLGGYLGGLDQVEQTVTIPANGTLRYWRLVDSLETMCGCDTMYVELLNTNHVSVATLNILTRLSGTGWRQESHNLASFAGQTLILRFSARNDWGNVTSFFIDDVTLS
jgi:thermitase